MPGMRPLPSTRLRGSRCPDGRSLTANGSSRSCDRLLLLLDDKVLLLLLSCLTLREQLLSFLPLTRLLYAAALRLPFAKHLVLRPPGHAFEAFLNKAERECVSFFPPHRQSTINSSERFSSCSSSSTSSPHSTCDSKTRCVDCAASEKSNEVASEKQLSEMLRLSVRVGCNVTTDRGSHIAGGSSVTGYAAETTLSRGTSNAGFHGSSVTNGLDCSAHDLRCCSRRSSTCSGPRLSALCMPGGCCPCCCIPVSFLHFSRLESADIAAPALTPPSPLLALLLLLSARSLKHLRIRGVDEGSYSWNASLRNRCQQQGNTLPQHQRSTRPVRQALQQNEGRQADADHYHVHERRQEEQQHQRHPRGNSCRSDEGGERRMEEEDYDGVTVATPADGDDGTPQPRFFATAKAAVSDGASASTNAAEGENGLTHRKRVRLRDYGPTSEKSCSWKEMVADSVGFAAAATATPALLEYMGFLHRSSSRRRRDLFEVKEGYTVVLREGDCREAACPFTVGVPSSPSDRNAASKRTGITAKPPGATVNTTEGGETAAPPVVSDSASGELARWNSTDSIGEGHTPAADTENGEEERALYWLPEKALQMLLATACNLETLAIDVSRRKGLYRVAPLARFSLVKEGHELKRRHSPSPHAAPGQGSSRVPQKYTQQWQLPCPQEQLHCEDFLHDCPSAEITSLRSPGRNTGAGQQCGSSTTIDEKCTLSVFSCEAARGNSFKHVTPTLCCDRENFGCEDSGYNLSMVLPDTADVSSASAQRWSTGKQKGYCQLRELEVCNITPQTFSCGYIFLPQLRILKLHFVEISFCERSVHDLGGLLQGCPLLESFAVHTDSDDDQMVFLNRMLIRSLGRFLRTRASPTHVPQMAHPIDAMRWEHQQHQGHQLEGHHRQHLWQEEHALLHQHGTQHNGCRQFKQEGQGKPSRSFTEGYSFEPRTSRLHHLKYFQMMLLDIRVVELLAQAAPNLEVLRLIETEAFRSQGGRNVLLTAVQLLPHLRRVELLGDLSEIEGSRTLAASFDAEARAREWPPGALSLHYGASVIQNFFLPQL